MKQIKLFIKGLIIGFGKIIPGVSGSIFAMIFGVYEMIIESLSDIKCLRKNFNMLFPIGTGIVFAIIFGSELIDFLLANYYLVSMSLFIGLMSYGLMPLIKGAKGMDFTKKEVFISIIIVVIFTSLLFVKVDVKSAGVENNIRWFISLFLCGILDALSTIIPGISGTAVLMILGYYEVIISSLANVFVFSSFKVLIPFFIGFVFGIIIISKIVNYLFKTHRNIMNLCIITFATISIAYLIFSVVRFITISNIVSTLIAFIIGFILSYLLENINQ